MAEEAAVQNAPSVDSALQTFAVHAGAKMRIDGQSDEWVVTVLEDGKVGWIRAEPLEPTQRFYCLLPEPVMLN